MVPFRNRLDQKLLTMWLCITIQVASIREVSARENEAVKHDLVEFKVQCLEVFVTMATYLPSGFLI